MFQLHNKTLQSHIFVAVVYAHQCGEKNIYVYVDVKSL